MMILSIPFLSYIRVCSETKVSQVEDAACLGVGGISRLS